MRGIGIVPLKSSLPLTASSIVAHCPVATFKHSFAKTVLQFAAFVVSIAVFVTCFSILTIAFATFGAWFGYPPLTDAVILIAIEIATAKLLECLVQPPFQRSRSLRNKPAYDKGSFKVTWISPWFKSSVCIWRYSAKLSAITWTKFSEYLQ